MKTAALFLLIVLLAFVVIPLNQTYASAVPVKTTTKALAIEESTTPPQAKSLQKIRLEKRRALRKARKESRATKKFRKRFKKHPNKTHHEESGFPWGWIAIGWYLLFIGLLITGIVLGIAFMWITALIMLLLPIVTAIIIFILLLVGLNGVSLC